MSAAHAARELGTSIPRVVRAIGRLGIEARTPSGRYAITPKDLGRLRRELGTTPRVDGRSRAMLRVMAAIESAPFGLVSVRAVARRACVSPATAARCVRTLEAEGVVVRRRRQVATEHSVAQMDVIYADLRAPIWFELGPQLRTTHLPRRKQPHPNRVPGRLMHLFWNTHPSQLNPKVAGRYIARRLLTTQDLQGLAWGAAHLTAEDWEHAGHARGISDDLHALAESLAGAA